MGKANLTAPSIPPDGQGESTLVTTVTHDADSEQLPGGSESNAAQFSDDAPGPVAYYYYVDYNKDEAEASEGENVS